MKLMHKNNKGLENGFITMIVMMVLILGFVIYMAYKRVAG
jgi:F0F1-type ATP synthase membrane subunit b/b'